MLLQLIQVAGALLILAAFALLQANRIGPKNAYYLAANLIGSATLAALAYADAQWGFLILEGAWAIVSAWGLLRVLSGAGRTAESKPR